MAHPKGLLIERAQKLGLERPEFDTAKTGPEHEPSFITDVVLDGEVIGTGQGRSKRDSEKAAAVEALARLEAQEAAVDDEDETAYEVQDGPFTGPWPMFDDLLASVVDVAERRVSADLRGDAALSAIRDFSLRLYKELLADLGEVVEEDEDEEDD